MIILKVSYTPIQSLHWYLTKHHCQMVMNLEEPRSCFQFAHLKRDLIKLKKCCKNVVKNCHLKSDLIKLKKC